MTTFEVVPSRMSKMDKESLGVRQSPPSPFQKSDSCGSSNSTQVARLTQGHVLTASGWLDSARGCASSVGGPKHPEHPQNQDALLVVEGFAGSQDTTLCALFDGHGPQGHLVAQAARRALPCLLSQKLGAHFPANAAAPVGPEDLCEKLCGLGMCDECSERCEDSSAESAADFWSDSSSPSTSSSCPGSASRAFSGSRSQLSEACSHLESWSGETKESTSNALETPERDDVPLTTEETVVPHIVFEDAFTALNDRVRHNPDIFPLCSGSTATVVLLSGSQLTVAHVGDSRCVLGVRGRLGATEAIQVTVDHTPCEPAERKRVEASGGRVLALRQEPEVARVWLPEGDLPGLAITRALGDEILKDYGVVCAPEVLRILLDETAQFVILGSEGLWSVLSNSEAVGIVGQCKDRVQAAERLVMAAKRMWFKRHGSGIVDDITAIVYFVRPLQLPFLGEQSHGLGGNA